MNKKFKKAIAASLISATMIAPTVANVISLSVSASQLLGETTFDEKMIPWQTMESSPASQYFELKDGALHIEILNGQGEDKEKWDLQLRHRNLNFKAGHTYEVSFKAKSNRNGMELCSQIATIKGDQYYFVLDGDEMSMGAAMGGTWGKAAKLTTEYQTFKGTFTPTKDIEGAEWGFHYAKGTQYEGNAQKGDEIWFDDMSIICTTCGDDYMPVCGYKGSSGGIVDYPDDDEPQTPPTDDPAVSNDVQVLGETSFDYKSLPWHTVTNSPAKQNFAIEDGAVHIDIINAVGGDHEKWDLRFQHDNLTFKTGHTYEVSFTAKSNRSGLELCSKICNKKGDLEYFVLNGTEMTMGPAMSGQWGKAAILSSKSQTFSGTFKPTEDIEGATWEFEYADGTQWEGNAQNGDEIWFEEMSIICTDCDEIENPCGYKGVNPTLGGVSRDYASKQNADIMVEDGEILNYISVNQVGYFTNLAKIATFSDNDGDILHNASKIKLTKDTYKFELVDAKTGEVVYEGVSGKKFADEDSDDNVCKLDFSEFNTPGEYYLRIKDTKWRSFNFKIGDDIYSETSHNMLTNALNYFYQNRSGINIEEKYITSGVTAELAHNGGHKTDTALVQKIWKNEYTTGETETYASSKITASGGWYDSGDHGKYMVQGGMSVWTLQNMYERTLLNSNNGTKFDDNSGICVVPEVENKIPDILDEAAYELDWMAKMKVDSDEPEWGKIAGGLYYHKLQDHKWTGIATKPYIYIEEWETHRIVKPPTFAATLNFAACAAQAARLWKPYNAEKAQSYLEAAVEAYDAYLKNWYEYDTTQVQHPTFDMQCCAEEINETSLYAPMYQAKSGAAFGDSEVRDDAYWAACEIFVTASEMGNTELAAEYKKQIADYTEAYKVPTVVSCGEYNGEITTSLNWGTTAAAGTLTLALHSDLLSETESEAVKTSILEAADKYVEIENEQGYGIPYLHISSGYNDPIGLAPHIRIDGYRDGSNAAAVSNAVIMAYAYDLTADKNYINGVAQTMDYMLGNNPLSFSYITGYGTYSVQYPHHRYWAYEADQSFPKAPDGVLAGGPSAELTDEYIRSFGFVAGLPDNPSQRCYVDSVEAWSSNNVQPDWNASLAWVVSFLQDEASDAPDAPVDSTVMTDVNYGDANCDGKVTIADSTAILQALGNPDKYALSEKGKANADIIDNGGGISVADAIAVQIVDAKLADIKSFPMTQEEYNSALNK